MVVVLASIREGVPGRVEERGWDCSRTEMSRTCSSGLSQLSNERTAHLLGQKLDRSFCLSERLSLWG